MPTAGPYPSPSPSPGRWRWTVTECWPRTWRRDAAESGRSAGRSCLPHRAALAQQRTGKPPSSLDWEDLGTEAIAAFLDHL